jgi:hypothetical protein
MGCSTPVGGAGGEVYYEGAPGQAAPRPTPSTKIQQSVPTPTAETTTMIEENWEAPRVKPQVGRPIQSTHQQAGQVSGRYSPEQIQQKRVAQQQAQRQQVQVGSRQPASSQPQRLTAAQVAARRAALQQRAEENGEENVRGATYQR